jgi:hypothetical protein
MNASAPALHPVPDWHSGFLKVLPAVQLHAQIQFRHFSPERREDLVQEAIASACVSFQLLAAKGKLHVATPATLATYAVRHVRSGRHVGSHQDSAKDVLSPVVRRRHGVQVIEFDTTGMVRIPRSTIGRTSGWRQVVVEDRKTPVPDIAAFRVDFAEWMRSLSRRSRKIISAMAARVGTMDLARRFKVSPGRISQLRRMFEGSWRQFQRQLEELN